MVLEDFRIPAMQELADWRRLLEKQAESEYFGIRKSKFREDAGLEREEGLFMITPGALTKP